MLFTSLGMAEPGHGGSKVTPMLNGNLPVEVPYCGLMENVSILCPRLSLKLTMSSSAAGAGKSVIWCDNLS
jgi:hypothetical protein